MAFRDFSSFEEPSGFSGFGGVGTGGGSDLDALLMTEQDDKEIGIIPSLLLGAAADIGAKQVAQYLPSIWTQIAARVGAPLAYSIAEGLIEKRPIDEILFKEFPKQVLWWNVLPAAFRGVRKAPSVVKNAFADISKGKMLANTELARSKFLPTLAKELGIEPSSTTVSDLLKKMTGMPNVGMWSDELVKMGVNPIKTFTELSPSEMKGALNYIQRSDLSGEFDDLLKSVSGTSALSKMIGKSPEASSYRVNMFRPMAQRVLDKEWVSPNSLSARVLGGTSLRDLLFSGFEQSPKYVQDLIGLHEARMGHIGHAVRSLPKLLENSSPEARRLFTEYVRYNEPLDSFIKRMTKSGVGIRELEELQKIVSPLEEGRKAVVQRYRSDDSRLLTEKKYLSHIESAFSRVLPEVHVKRIVDMIGGIEGRNVEDVQNGLYKVIQSTSPTSIEHVIAKDLVSLPNEAPKKVYRAWEQASKASLASQLIEGGLAVRPVKFLSNPASLPFRAENYIPLRGKEYGELSGLYVEKNTAKAWRELNDVQPTAMRLWNRYFMQPWKMTRVVRIPTLMRNLYGDIMLNDTDAVNPLSPANVGVYKRALMDMIKSNRLSSDKTKSTNMFDRFLLLSGKSPGTVVTAELSTLLEDLARNENMMDVALGSFHKIMAPLVRLREASESWIKYAKFLHNLDSGMSESESLRNALDATFNYAHASMFARRVRNTALPFFTWQSNVLKTFPTRFVAHPLRTMKYAMIPAAISMYAIDKLGMSGHEYQKFEASLPNYLSNGWIMILPYRDNRGRISVLDLTWMIPGLGDMFQVSGAVRPGEMVSDFFKSPVSVVSHIPSVVQNPLVTVIGGLMNNKTYTGAPIYYEWDSPDAKSAKILKFISENTIPGFLPGGYDFNSFARAVENLAYKTQEKPTFRGYETVVSDFLGIKRYPVDVQYLSEEKVKLMSKFASELKSRLRRELERETDPKRRIHVIRKYQDAFLNIKDKVNTLSGFD